ncbi:hypothetical protein I8748_30170 [Nostoc sp. CENA67]|uniref:Uncharacterized protein n=1 Tax=Amazonocrinis nigriterrae CENA67 TaxID=2794033 RepID=A0A8J7LCC8_9NOST|nr:hypothetical protein [Amazonocrinis nigriterrae]MBH8566371.1 hypothetical protein [Amazonocrinis nigriterrae CENA67]
MFNLNRILVSSLLAISTTVLTLRIGISTDFGGSTSFSFGDNRAVAQSVSPQQAIALLSNKRLTYETGSTFSSDGYVGGYSAKYVVDLYGDGQFQGFYQSDTDAPSTDSTNRQFSGNWTVVANQGRLVLVLNTNLWGSQYFVITGASGNTIYLNGNAVQVTSL